MGRHLEVTIATSCRLRQGPGERQGGRPRIDDDRLPVQARGQHADALLLFDEGLRSTFLMYCFECFRKFSLIETPLHATVWPITAVLKSAMPTSSPPDERPAMLVDIRR
jgi:hypothetical protein